MTCASDELERVLDRFKETQFVALATFDGARPRVRPMTLICLDRRFWMVTSAASSKVMQIRQNPDVELPINSVRMTRIAASEYWGRLK